MHRYFDKFFWTRFEYRRGLRCGKSRIRSALDALREAFQPLPF